MEVFLEAVAAFEWVGCDGGVVDGWFVCLVLVGHCY